jgi:iron complex outermembrane recepter protein
MKTYRLFATSAVIAIAAFGTTAYAQDAETSEGGIADIVVTAQKRAENVQDVPIAISAVTSETLESRGVRSVFPISPPMCNWNKARRFSHLRRF